VNPGGITIWRSLRLGRRTGAVLGAVLMTAGLVACNRVGSTGAPVEPGDIKVVTTTTVFADLVANIGGGGRVSVSSIVPPGVGPEDFEPKPDDAKLLRNAELIVSNGVGLDDFLDDLLASGSGGATPRLVLGEGIPALTEDGEANPHFWLDPTLVRDHYVPKIAAKLSEIDPPGRATYEANAQIYAAKLDQLDTELKAKVEQVPPENRKLVTFHDAFPYFAEHFGFDLVGVILENVGQEPTAAELATLVEEVRAANVKAVFSEAQFSPDLTDTLAREAGITNVVTTLFTDALGPPPADTYTGMMTWNVDQIVAALK